VGPSPGTLGQAVGEDSADPAGPGLTGQDIEAMGVRLQLRAQGIGPFHVLLVSLAQQRHGRILGDEIQGIGVGMEPVEQLVRWQVQVFHRGAVTVVVDQDAQLPQLFQLGLLQPQGFGQPAGRAIEVVAIGADHRPAPETALQGGVHQKAGADNGSSTAPLAPARPAAV